MKMLAWSDWLEANPPPNFAKLVEQYGEYWDIPHDVWDRFQEDVVKWRERYRTRDGQTRSR